MRTANFLLKNRFFPFCLECISLGTARGRLAAFGTGIAVVVFLVPKAGSFPDLCLFDRFFGYCPACGTTRALSCFFRGQFPAALSFNRIVLVTGPLIIFIFLKDLLSLLKRK